MKKMPRWAIIGGFTLGGLLILSGVLVLIWPFIISGVHKPQPTLGIGNWLMVVITLILFLALMMIRPNIMFKIFNFLSKITRIRITFKQTEDDKDDEEKFHVFLSSNNDAIAHLLILGREFSSLNILRGAPGWPIVYPIKLHNVRPYPIEIVGFTATILLNDKPVQVIKWDKPENQTSNGSPMNHPFYLESDQWMPFPIRVILAQMQATLPINTPFWGVQGELRLKGHTKILNRSFDFSKDNYTLSQADWDDLRKNAMP